VSFPAAAGIILAIRFPGVSGSAPFWRNAVVQPCGRHHEGGLGRRGDPAHERTGVDPVWWTPLKLIFEVSDATLPHRLSAGVPATDGRFGANWPNQARLGPNPPTRATSPGPSACRLGEAYSSQGERCSGAAGDLGDRGARGSCGMLNRCPRSTVGEHMPDPRITPCVLGPAAIAPSSFGI
jgi:hypothetical protein